MDQIIWQKKLVNLETKIGLFYYFVMVRDLLWPDEEPGGVQHPQPALCHLPDTQANSAGVQQRILWSL